MASVGKNVVLQIHKNLQIDKEWTNSLQAGFEWWPHRLKQKVIAAKPFVDQGIEVHKIFISTDLVKEVRASEVKIREVIASAGVLATNSALVFDPDNRTIKLWTTAIVHEETSGWMAKVLAAFAILQVIEAEDQVDALAKIVDGQVEKSAHPKSGVRRIGDSMLSVVNDVFQPQGARRSAWANSQEFSQIRDLANQSNWFSMGDDNGLTAEYPFGNSTAMLQIKADEEHPILGSGVGMFLHLPLWSKLNKAAEVACSLNRGELSGGTMMHLTGSWCLKEISGQYLPAFAQFIPSALYQPGILLNFALPMMTRARWVSSLFNPGEKVDAITSIILKRFSSL